MGEQFVVNLALAVAAAGIGGAIAARLGLPVVVGYLVGGFVLGPYTPGPVVDPHTVEMLAELGVAFLMFALGAELPLAELRRMGPLAALGGSGQILGTIALVVLVSPLLGLPAYPGLYLGALVALSSTAVALKLLGGRGELGSLHGRVVIAFAVVQDLALVPLMVLLPALGRPTDAMAGDLGLALVKTVGFLAVTLVVGTHLVPLLLARVAASGSRELFLLAVVGIALGIALAAQVVGLSLAFGAFLGGMLVAESEMSHQAVADILPLRDL
ncbi:MAG: cation:proton antiporter, partial [Acetobacteraceae bacterium]|nr:cation:proton antiporter [Acetobacteraceae bacterium]